MSRTTDENRPIELIDAIVRYLVRNGLAGLSLRPLAKAVKSSPRVLLYYFGSKEQMIVQVLAELRRRQRASFDQLPSTTFETDVHAAWKAMSAPASLPLFRLYFEACGIALRQPHQYKEFLRATVDDWLDYLASPLHAEGCSRAQSRAFASVVLAGLRGFMLDLCATANRRRVNQAVNLWLPTLPVMLRVAKEAR